MANTTQTITLAKAEGDSNYKGGFSADGAFSIHAEFGKAVLVSVAVKTSGNNYAEVFSGFRSDMDEDFGFLVYPKDVQVSVQDDGFTAAPSIAVTSGSTITPES